MAIPLLPPARYVDYEKAIGLSAPVEEQGEIGLLPLHFALRFGWEELIEAVDTAHATLSEEERTGVAVFGHSPRSGPDSSTTADDLFRCPPPTQLFSRPVRRSGGRCGVNLAAHYAAPSQTYCWRRPPTRGDATTVAAGEGGVLAGLRKSYKRSHRPRELGEVWLISSYVAKLMVEELERG
jgi:hypothetical protein